METTPEITAPAKKHRQVKPKVAAFWAEEDTYNLIHLIKSHPTIWNSEHNKYSDKTTRKYAWKQIAEYFHGMFHVDEVVAKWSNLRIQYRWYAVRAKNKTQPPKWKYFKALSFVDNVKGERRTSPMKSRFYLYECI